MSHVTLVVPAPSCQRWHIELAHSLERAGHRVTTVAGNRASSPYGLDAVLAFERKIFRRDTWLADTVPSVLSGPAPDGEIVVALADARVSGVPHLAFSPDPTENTLGLWSRELAAGHLPVVEVFDEGRCIARGEPMIDNRISIGRGLDDVASRAIDLMVKAVGQRLSGKLPGLRAASRPQPGAFLGQYLTALMPRFVAELLRRRRFQTAHWRVGYRFVSGPGVGTTASLAGAPWSVLDDDGERFYADPFPFSIDGKHFIFVEELEHAKGKAVISVSQLDEAGRASRPEPVLEEAHHLSYPQVFAHQGDVWMLPEASAGNELVLYRASNFPNKWERHAVLIAGRAISDATLIEHQDRFWLLATDATSGGSTSDMLVAYHANDLSGPWIAHSDNPIMINRSAARPGGAAIKTDSGLFLPVQDGTLGYGGGLGLSRIVQLDPRAVKLEPPHPIAAEGFWPYPRIHTLNRYGGLEVIDGIADVHRKPVVGRKSASIGVNFTAARAHRGY